MESHVQLWKWVRVRNTMNNRWLETVIHLSTHKSEIEVKTNDECVQLYLL